MLPATILACPDCHGELTGIDHALRCSSCHALFQVSHGVPLFIRDMKQHSVPSHQRDQPHTLAGRLLRVLRPPHHSVYFHTLTPSYREGSELKRFLRDHPTLDVLNIGSLSMSLRHVHSRVINLDVSYYKNVDVVADAHQLPFKSASIDVVLLKNVLEHIRAPAVVMREVRRVLKPGGILYIKLPFLQPFHAVPNDYQRYTISGIHELLKGYQELEFGVSVGPSSMLSWVLREYLAVLTSFGQPLLYRAGIVVWGWVTFWIKYADLCFPSNSLADGVASAFYGFYRRS